MKKEKQNYSIPLAKSNGMQCQLCGKGRRKYLWQLYLPDGTLVFACGKCQDEIIRFYIASCPL